MAHFVPQGCRTVTASLTIKGAKAAIDFYQRAFGAEVLMNMEMPNGAIGHAELKIGDSIIFLNEECEQGFIRSPQTLGGTTGGIQLYVEDCDAMFARAIKAGGTEKFPLTDWFWGDRGGHLIDPFGHVWGVSTHKEDLTQEEIATRAEAFFKSMSAGAPA